MAKNSGIKVMNGGSANQTSFNPFDGGTAQFNGASHEQGGIDMTYGGNQVEVEGGETAVKDNAGDLHIMGNMTIPGTKTKFKQVSKAIAEQEKKYGHIMDKGMKLVDNNSPRDKYEKLKFNTGKLMMDGATQGMMDLSVKKNQLTQLQTAMLDTAAEMGVDSISLSEGKIKQAKYGARIPSAQAGNHIPPNEFQDLINNASARYGVNPAIINRLINQESGYDPTAISRRNAQGIMQFIPATAAQYGITEEQLTSTDPKDIEAVINAGIRHFSDLLKRNNGDYKLALAAYNGGQGAVNFVKRKLGAKKITGEQWEDFMAKRRKSSPTVKKGAWQNETYDYVNNIMGTTDSEFYEKGAAEYREKYYNPTPAKPLSPLVNPEKIAVPKVNVDLFQPSKIPTNINLNLGGSNYTSPQSTVINTTSGDATSSSPNDTYKFNTETKQAPPYQSTFDMLQILPEITSILDNRLEPVPAQRYEPNLFQPYQQSFQDKMNRNTATFNAIVNAQALSPTALSSFAAQKYEADAAIQAEEFRVNQGIANTVYNQNINLLNDAQLKNLGIADVQYERQAKARSNTKAQLHTAISSIADKYVQHKRDNLNLVLQQQLFNFRPKVDENGNIIGLEYKGPDVNIRNTAQGTPATNQTTKKTTDEVGNVTTSVTTASPLDTQLKQVDLQKKLLGISNMNIFKAISGADYTPKPKRVGKK